MILSAVPVRSHMELQEQVDDLLATIDHNGYHLRDFLEPEEIAECITEENGKEVVDCVTYLGIDITELDGSDGIISELEEQLDTVSNKHYRQLFFIRSVKEAATIEEVRGIVDAWENQVEAIENPMAEMLTHAENALRAIARSTKSKAILSIISNYRSKTA